jgi:hypothetical protein
MWFILAEAKKYDSKWGAKVSETAFWNDERGEWDGSTGTVYRTRDEAEAMALFLLGKVMSKGFEVTVGVFTFEEVKDRYGIKIGAPE